MVKFCKHALLFLLLLPAMIVSAQLGKTIDGNNRYVTIEKKIKDFSSLKVSIDAVVDYEQNPDSVGKVSIYAEENIAHLIEFYEQDGRLNIRFISSTLTVKFGTIRIKLFSSSLDRAELLGGALLQVAKPLETKSFTIALEGKGQAKIKEARGEHIKAVINGSADLLIEKGDFAKAEYSIIGSGEIRNEFVTTGEAICFITGSGIIRCHVGTKLSATIVGSGQVRYKGTPEIKISTLSSKAVYPFDQEIKK